METMEKVMVYVSGKMEQDRMGQGKIHHAIQNNV